MNIEKLLQSDNREDLAIGLNLLYKELGEEKFLTKIEKHPINQDMAAYFKLGDGVVDCFAGYMMFDKNKIELYRSILGPDQEIFIE